MVDIISLLEEKALTESKKKGYALDSDIFRLRGIWQSSYVLRLTEEESVFHLHYVLAQTVGQGCCYYDPSEESVAIDAALLGKNVFSLSPDNRILRIAALDAIYSSLVEPPLKSHILNGSNIEKAHERSMIVCDEAFRLLDGRRPKSGQKKLVVNVGVVGSFLKIFSERKGLDVKAIDMNLNVVGKSIHGVVVERGTKQGSVRKGDRTLELIAEADVAVITGMTLATNTLSDIITIAQQNNTSIVVFAETGANFAAELCKIGVEVVVSEPFPFYLTSYGPTQIKIYRKR